MELGRVGIWYPTDRLDAAGLRALLRTVEGHGYGTLWYPESRGFESIALAGFLLANSERRRRLGMPAPSRGSASSAAGSSLHPCARASEWGRRHGTLRAVPG